MVTTLSDFVAQSLAERNSEDKWIVYVDGENKRGAISGCKGETEYEAKEDAWFFYQELIAATKQYRK